MIPKKLYIPTSTLNFNNIMSSESISPASFYTYRRFGYKRFEKVAPNDFDNQLILYKKYPIFDIDDKELENYPLVIEVDTRFVSEDSIKEKEGIFYTTGSVYLNPFSTRIIFRNEEERNTSLSKAEPSIESKLIPLYQGQFVVLSDAIDTFEWNPVTIEELPDYDRNAVSFDIAINKLKGMIYGYLLGANSSSSKEVVSLKRKVKELRNVLSAILASPDGRATAYQQQQLDGLYGGINQILYRLSGIESRINENIAQKVECYNSPHFVDILKGEGLYQEWLERQVVGMNIRYRQITPFYLTHRSTDVIVELDRYIDDVENVIQTYDVKANVGISQLPIVQNRRIVEIPEQKGSLVLLFNEYMNEAWNGTEFLSSRYEFAKAGGKLFREISGDRWENSPVRTYINSLLKNLNEYTEFDLNSIDSVILKSFAAFCQKGESDIDKLRDYLIANGVGDFRIAFALWGLVFGFAEMPKTLTKELFESRDNQYLSDCYKYIFKQLHAIDLEGVLDRTLKIVVKPICFLQGVKNIGKKVAEPLSGKTLVQTKDPDGTTVQRHLEHRVTSIPEELKMIFDSGAFKEIPSEAQLFYKKESLSLYQGDVNKTYIEALKKLEYPRTKGKWQNTIKLLLQRKRGKETIGESPRRTSDMVYKQETLFEERFFCRDRDAWNKISDIVPIEVQYKIKADLEWFQKEVSCRNAKYGYDKINPDNNKEVIEKYYWLKWGKNKNGVNKAPYYTEELRKAIKERLLSLYCNNE